MAQLGSFAFRLGRARTGRGGPQLEFPFHWHPQVAALRQRAIADVAIARHPKFHEAEQYCGALLNYFKAARWLVPDRGSAQDRQARDLGITAFELMIDVAFTQRVWPLPLEAGGLERMLDRFCSLLKHLVQNGHGTLDATDVYEGVYGPGRAVSLRVLGSPGTNTARGLTVRPVLQHAQTAKYLLVLQRKFGILRAQGKTGWIPFDIGLLEFVGKFPHDIAVAQRRGAAAVQSAIPADPASAPPGGGFCDCALGDVAFPVLTNAEIAALPDADRAAKLDQVQAIRDKRRVLLTTRAGRQEKVTSWRAAITARPASYLDFHGPTVLFALQLGALRVRSAPQQGLQAVNAAIELRTRFITAFEHGWSLTDLQTDLATTFRGHFGQRALSPAERRAEVARLQAEKQALVQQGAAAAKAAPKPKAPEAARPKRAAQPKGPAPGVLVQRHLEQGDAIALPAPKPKAPGAARPKRAAQPKGPAPGAPARRHLERGEAIAPPAQPAAIVPPREPPPERVRQRQRDQG